MKQLDGTGMKRLHREWRRRTEGRLALVLDDVQGPFNVGAIIRTAAALRVDDVWLSGPHARARRHQGRQDRPRHPALPDASTGRATVLERHRRRPGRRLPGGRRRAGRRRRRPPRARRSAAATCLVVGHEDRGLRARDPRRLRRRRLPPPARQGRVPQRGHGRRHRLLRGAPAGLGYSPLDGSIIANTWVTDGRRAARPGRARPAPPDIAARRRARRSPTVPAWPNRPCAPSATTSSSRRPASSTRHARLDHRRGQRGLGRADRRRPAHGAFSAAGQLVGLTRRLRRPTSPCPAATVAAGWRHRGGGALHPPAAGPPHPAHAEPSSTPSPTSGSRSPSSSRPSGPSTGASGTAPPIDACRFEIDTADGPRSGSRPRLDRAGRPRRAPPCTSRPPTRPAGPAPRARSAAEPMVLGAHRRRRRAGPGQTFDAGLHRGALWRDDGGCRAGCGRLQGRRRVDRNRPAGRSRRAAPRRRHPGGRAGALAPPLRDRLDRRP